MGALRGGRTVVDHAACGRVNAYIYHVTDNSRARAPAAHPSSHHPSASPRAVGRPVIRAVPSNSTNASTRLQIGVE